MIPAGPGLAVGASSRTQRRALGPTAWAVLEDFALDAAPSAGGGLVAATNVRRLAANVGMSKDAAARALRRLLDAGVVVRVPPPRQPDGTFGPIGYRLCAERLVGVHLVHGRGPSGGATADGRNPASRRRQNGSLQAPSPPAQAALFDLVPTAR